MIYQGQKIDFPSATKISFFKLIEDLEDKAKDEDPNISSYAKDLLSEVEKYPELRDGFDDRALLKKHEKLIKRLSDLLFPKVLLTNEIKGLVPPFDFTPFRVSTRFQRILDNVDGGYSFELKDLDPDLFYIYGASAILGIHYGYKIDSGTPTTVEIADKANNFVRSYRLAYNADLTELIPTDWAPKVTKEDYKELIDDFYNIDLWKEKFPPNSYVMRGIGVVNLMEVTQDSSLASITSNLLTKSQESVDKILISMRNLFGIQDLEGGFVEFGNDHLVRGSRPKDKGMQSIILEDDIEMDCQTVLSKSTYNQLIVDKEPLIITDTDLFDRKAKSLFSQRLKNNKKIGSFIMAPLVHEGNFLGLMEFVSPRKYDLNGSLVAKLDLIVPIFSMAIARFKEEEQNTREAIIQQECTTIHSSVKWRFDEEADKYIAAQFNKEQPTFKDIVFKDVYPLYGQLDIKGSSEKRNEAIKGDVLEQIKGVRKVLSSALKTSAMPVYEELMFRLDVYREEIRQRMSSESEQQIQNFINDEINPVFSQLEEAGGVPAELIKNYRELLDPELGLVYNLRKNFDSSVNTINQTLASMLDAKQEEAQRMFPHYFERYKTDGVEYNMYIGQSISGSKPFNKIFLKNIRLWQLLTNCELENRFEELKKDIATPLEVASLILVYNSPLAVHFRMDEKRFDVEGAYNARYEIVKKRVDKAHIKGTKDRITIPGKIAIIYNNEHDADEYRTYIKYLQAKGYIKKGSLEQHELEDLQGITGLKALRIEVNYNSNQFKTDLSLDKLLEGIRGN